MLFSGVMECSLFAQDYPIYAGQKLSKGFEIAVNSYKEKTDWFSDSLGYMKMVYPPDQKWGAAFLTVGELVNPPRPFKDFSKYKYLIVELKGAVGGEKIDISIKDNTDADDIETRKTFTLTSSWEPYKIALSDFTTADLTHLYVVTEFVFHGNQSETVYFRNIKYGL